LATSWNARSGFLELVVGEQRWQVLDETVDMAHNTDAVSWWNSKGRFHGEESTEVRAWMNDPDNYTLQPRSINRSEGARIGKDPRNLFAARTCHYGAKRTISMNTHRLDDETHERITSLCEEGDRLVEQRNDREALDKYYEAWDLVPPDKENWEASTWILASAGEVYVRHKRYDKALHSFRSAVRCPNGLGNPYVHLRLGQIEFEMGNQKDAADELTRAYMGAGEEIFEKEDSKYLSFLKTILRPPAVKPK
jgi:tetratricopeptide (TPR) repeat protein